MFWEMALSFSVLILILQLKYFKELFFLSIFKALKLFLGGWSKEPVGKSYFLENQQS